MTLVYISGALVAGILAGSKIDLLPWPFFIAAGLVLIAGLLLRAQPRIIYLFLLVALLVGIGRGAIAPGSGPPEQLQGLAGSSAIVVSGIVDDYPESRGALTQFRFSVQRYRADGGWVETLGLLLVRAKPSIPMIEERSPPFFRYGDTLVLKGNIEQPPVLEDFDWREHLAREGVHYLMLRPEVELTGGGGGVRALGWVYRVREEMAASLGRSLPEPRASLAQALLLGIRGGLPSELREDFAKTGTTHLLAISGLHVGILVGLVSLGSAALLGRRGQIYIVIPLLFVWVYAVLTGFPPPVVRAAIMASLYLWAILLGRQRSGLTALSGAAAIMVTVDPDILEEVSFQLSFVSMAGLLLLGPWFRAGGLRLVARYWEPEGVAGGVVKFLVEASAISLAVILATFPIIGFNFQFLSPVGLPATVPVLPVLPFVLVSSLAVAVAGIFSETAGQILAWGTWPWLSWMTGVIRAFAWVPGLKVNVGPADLYFTLFYYAFLLCLLWWARRMCPRALVQSELPEFPTLRSTAKPGLSALFRQKRTIFLLGVILLTIGVFSVAAVRPTERLSVTVLDVGQGESILIQGPDRLTVLVDGGPNPATLVLELGQRLPHWQHSVDLIVLTHPDSDHLSGLMGLLERYDVDHVIQCGAGCTTAGNEADLLSWTALLGRSGISPLEAEAGTRVLLGEDIGLQVLHPPPRPLAGTSADSNNNSVVLRLEYGDVSFLLTGDIEAFAESYLLRQGVPLSSSVMTAPHHGSRSSSTPEFIAAVDPQLVVISAGLDNRYGHPHPETLVTLAQHVSAERILITSEVGGIQIETDGTRLWLTTEK